MNLDYDVITYAGLIAEMYLGDGPGVIEIEQIGNTYKTVVTYNCGCRAHMPPYVEYTAACPVNFGIGL